MMEIKTTEIAGLFSAIRGMRVPMKSLSNADSSISSKGYKVGTADLELAQKLSYNGSEHAKYLRQIQVWAEMKMPRYWWQEFDQYHFHSTNSESTMHTILKEDLTSDDFCDTMGLISIEDAVEAINDIKKRVGDTDPNIGISKQDALVMIKRILPESYLQKRMVNVSYAELLNVYHQRKNHRLNEEWQDTFCKWCETLPYFKEMCIDPIERRKNDKS